MGYYLGSLTLHLTEECNLGCRYCFQKRRSRSLGFSSVTKALEFFKDAFDPQSFICFYGGEPLLEFNTIRRTVAYIQNHPALRRKKLRYSISTNGSLLTNEILRFLNKHRFRVNLSHDGTAQDITRPSKLNPLILENMNLLTRLPGIDFETNSVFVPATAGEVYRSVRYLLERGVRNCHLTYSIIHPWNSASLEQMREQVQELRKFLISHYRRHYTIPIGNFQNRPIRSMFWCPAGQDRLAVAVDGRLWGCRFFADFFTDKSGHPEFYNYCLGEIQELVRRPQNEYSAIYKSYRILYQDGFSSEQQSCRKCARLLSCSTCPATVAFSTDVIGRVPAWMCDINDIWLQEARKFWQEVDKS